MGQANNRIDELPPSAGADQPTVGEIKRALHELTRGTFGAAQRDTGAILREVQELVRRLALRNDINPDDALQRRLAAVELQRERMALASATGADQASG